MEKNKMELTGPIISGVVAGIAFLVIINLSFPIVNADDKSWVAYTPKQCQQTPWANYDIVIPEYDDTEGWLNAVGYLAAEYYKAHGITVYNYTAIGGRIVPAMCGYDAGYEIYLQVSDANVFRMEAMGFKQENPS